MGIQPQTGEALFSWKREAVRAQGQPSTYDKPFSREALERAIWFNTWLLAAISGLISGLALFSLTHLSLLLTGERAGQYLDLLGIIFPGYRASTEGAWFGLIWAFILGSLSGAFVYQTYVRTAGAKALRNLCLQPTTRQVIPTLTLMISGPALGLSLGLLTALQLIGVTWWLVLRGTAPASYHAALLKYYLPGYSPSLIGGLIGGAWLFLYSYGFARLFAGIYNRVARWNNRGDVHERGGRAILAKTCCYSRCGACGSGGWTRTDI
jgi:hypothetical protein